MSFLSLRKTIRPRRPGQPTRFSIAASSTATSASSGPAGAMPFGRLSPSSWRLRSGKLVGLRGHGDLQWRGAISREQLADLAAQSVLPAELVVCDDGSTDDTLAILERFAITAPFPVRVHRNSERLGYRANFLKCAGLCRSDLIAFCDQDDRWAPRKIETMRRLLRRSRSTARLPRCRDHRRRRAIAWPAHAGAPDRPVTAAVGIALGFRAWVHAGFPAMAVRLRSLVAAVRRSQQRARAYGARPMVFLPRLGARARSSMSKRRSSAIASTARMSLAGPRQSAP